MNEDEKQKTLVDIAALMIMILDNKVSAFAYGVAYQKDGEESGYDYHFRGTDRRLYGIVDMMATHIRAEDAQK